jgi:hypothetical protein
VRPETYRETLIMASNKELSKKKLPFKIRFLSAGSEYTALDILQYQLTHRCSEDNCSIGRTHMAKTTLLVLP